MSKPRKTAADYMVIAISPMLIMALVGSLCFFLIEVFYRGKMLGGVSWVMFWFIIGIVLVSRIAIESSPQNAAMYGLGLAGATWIYMMRTEPAYLVGIVLLAIVWFCAHKLVWDCTLIDEDADSSGQGLLQKEQPPAPVKQKPPKKPSAKIVAPHSPGRWVVYFSLAALPLFGIGQMLLPASATDARRMGFIFLAVYLAAGLGLLVTTSFLGLRRYLRQRYLKMPATIARAWLKFGVGIAIFVLIGALFLPRPGANAAWAALSYQINYIMGKASQYATAPNAPGQDEGKPGNDTGGKQGTAQAPSQEQQAKQTSGEKKPGETPSQSRPTPAPMTPPGGNIFNLLRAAFWIVVALIVGIWMIRQRYMLLEMIRSIIAAIREFFRRLFDLVPARKAAKRAEFAPPSTQFSAFSEYTNPFFATPENAWPPEQIMIYTYEAVQVWAKEQGITVRPELTARELCGELGEHYAEMEFYFGHLARLYGYAAYRAKLPPNSDLEPIRELWRRLPTYNRATTKNLQASV